MNERFAFLPADNQTGDASFSWMSRVEHQAVAVEAGSGATGYVDVGAARASNANRFVYSTLTKNSQGLLELHSEVFDPSKDTLLREYSVTGSPLEMVDRMAANFTTKVTPLGVRSETGLKQWASLGQDPAQMATQCAALADSDPAFGAALGTCLERLTPAGEMDAVHHILERSGGLAKGFPLEGQLMFAQSYYAAKEFAKAAELFRLAAPNQPAALNMLGYSETLAGNYEAGKASLEQYARQPGQEANALDSLGEVSFFAGQWKAAEQYFGQAVPRWPPQAQQQSDLDGVKAGVARLMSGDAAGAKELVSARIELIRKRNPAQAAGIESLWKAILSAPNEQARLKLIHTTLIRRPI